MCAFLKKMFVQKNILGWREVCSMSRMKTFIKKETVLSIAILLAVISVFLVLPDRQYLDYIDFRTLGILFSLMVVVAGLRQLGLFGLQEDYYIECMESEQSQQYLSCFAFFHPC